MNKTLQTDLFGFNETTNISINEAAENVGVSIATIRNWIKTGYLRQTSKGKIDNKSFLLFIDEIAGKEKLNSRANKLLKDSHDHQELSSNLNEEINSVDVEFQYLGDKYENSLSDSYRNQEGVYYTPESIVKDMLKDLPKNISTKTFCDPCCGSGNFLLEAIEHGIPPENIYGFDIDANAIAIAKKRIFEKTGYNSDNIILKDFLSEANSIEEYQFDYIFTNPPWGKKIARQQKEKYALIFNAGKSLDTSALFFFASLRILQEGGQLGFLLPEAFFNISTFESARKKALSLEIIRLIDYGKAFKGLVTKAQAIILTKNYKVKEKYLIKCEEPQKTFQRNNISFLANPKSIFNFWLDEESSEVVKTVFNYPHKYLLNNAEWGLGIVTGNNKRFCKSSIEEGYIPVFKGSDIQKNSLKKPSNFIPKDTSLYQQVAPISLYEAEEKLIYKFISSKLCFFCDTEKRYILNSANMLILNKSFPISSQQLCDLLNSEFMNWIFKNIFNTHKILRSDLESLPIHTEYFKQYYKFNENDYLNYLNIRKMNNGTYRIKR